MRFLCLSDVHGHLGALRAVLASAERRGFDKLLVAGDLCFPGPEPLETLRLLLQWNAICVQGVTDKALSNMSPTAVEAFAKDSAQRLLAERFAATRTELGEVLLAKLRRLPTHQRLKLDDGRDLLLVHGSPADPTEPFTHDLDDDEATALIGDDPADVIVCGQSHTPFVRQLGEVMIVNVGSVGEAPGGKTAQAAFIESSVAGVIVDPFAVELA